MGYIIERPRVCNIINKECTVCASVKGCAEWLIALLPGRVPNLQRDHLSINRQLFVWEVSANGWLEILGEARMFKHLNEACLAYATIPNCYNFYETLLVRSLQRHPFYIAWLGLLWWLIIGSFWGWDCCWICCAVLNLLQIPLLLLRLCLRCCGVLLTCQIFHISTKLKFFIV